MTNSLLLLRDSCSTSDK